MLVKLLLGAETLTSGLCCAPAVRYAEHFKQNSPNEHAAYSYLTIKEITQVAISQMKVNTDCHVTIHHRYQIACLSQNLTS